MIADQLKEKLEEKIKKYIAEIPFKPKINKHSELIVEMDEEKAKENFQDKIDRLAIKDKEKKDIIQ